MEPSWTLSGVECNYANPVAASTMKHCGVRIVQLYAMNWLETTAFAAFTDVHLLLLAMRWLFNVNAVEYISIVRGVL